MRWRKKVEKSNRWGEWGVRHTFNEKSRTAVVRVSWGYLPGKLGHVKYLGQGRVHWPSGSHRDRYTESTAAVAATTTTMKKNIFALAQIAGAPKPALDVSIIILDDVAPRHEKTLNAKEIKRRKKGEIFRFSEQERIVCTARFGMLVIRNAKKTM